MKKKQQVKRDISSINLIYEGVHCNYDYTDCTCDKSAEYYYCCRCRSIIREEVSSVDYAILRKYLQKEVKSDCSKIDSYCIDRIFAINKLYDTSSYEIVVTGGYYGEEIGGIYIKNKNIQKTIDEFLLIEHDNEKIEFVLKLEYGYLLDELRNLNWSVVTIDKSQVVFNGYYKKAVNELDIYKNLDKSTIRGIYIKNGDKYRLIDGYHRFVTAPKYYEILLGEEE